MAEGIKQKANGNNNFQVNGDLVVNLADIEQHALSMESYIKWGYIFLLVSILGTTLPHPIVNIVTSVFAVAAGLIVCVMSLELRRTNRRSASFNRLKFFILSMTFLSIVAGCAGPMLAKFPDPQITNLTKDFKSGVDQGVGIFGFYLQNINIQSAAEKGGIEDVYFADQIRGYGLISYTKIKVFGE